MKRILHNILFTVGFVFVGLLSYGQQIPQSSHFQETRYVWNPAFTAHGTDMQLDAFFRMQWIGFNGSPKTGYASFLYPLLDYNMSFGGILQTDHTGPVRKTGIQLNYAYKLRELFGFDDQLSIGLGASYTQYSFNTENEVFNDVGDLLIASGRNSTFYPSISAGFSYISNIEEYNGSNIFYLGFAFNQIYTTELSIENGLLQRKRHVHFTAGGKFFGYSGYFEPSISFNTVNPEILHLLVSGKYEFEERFWVGLGYSSGNEMSIQGGVILDGIMDRYSSLRIGALGNYSLSELNTAQGPGFEILISYLYDLD